MLAPSSVAAGDITASGFIEAGNRSQAEDYDEEENDREYRYQYYHLKLRYKPSDIFNYEFGSFIYDKDYSSNDSLDNISKIINAKASYILRKTDRNTIKLTLKFKYKEKRFRNKPSSEYNQVLFSPKLSFAEKNSYKIDLGAGVNNYDYLNSGNDQLKLFSALGVKKYLLEKTIVLTSSYKFETTTSNQAGKRRNKNNIMFGADYIFDVPFIYKISTRVRLGQRDTKDDDNRDEDYDYKYTKMYVTSEHRMSTKTKTRLKFEYYNKDYLTADRDHRGFFVLNSWRLSVMNNNISESFFNISLKHKDIHYSLKTGSDNQKETLGLKWTYKRKKRWKASVSSELHVYDYADPDRNRNRYYARLAFEKLLVNNASLSLNLKYKYTDNRHTADTEEKAARLGFKYSF